MMNVATFLQSIDNARGRRSDKEISQAAGLSGNAVAAMRAGKVPSLERAARVAEVVGLELCLRRKGEAISPWALRLALEVYFRRLQEVAGTPPLTESDIAGRAETLSAHLEALYKPLAGAFDPSECDDPDGSFAVMQTYARFLKTAQDDEDALRATALWDLATGTSKSAQDQLEQGASDDDADDDGGASTP